MYKIAFTKRAASDIPKLKAARLFPQAQKLLEVIAANPYQPKFEKLAGDYSGAYSRRINRKHRIVYRIYDDEKIVKIISM